VHAAPALAKNTLVWLRGWFLVFEFPHVSGIKGKCLLDLIHLLCVGWMEEQENHQFHVNLEEP
jgi:hypothetical protein